MDNVKKGTLHGVSVGLLANSAMVCNCGLPDEAVFPALTDYDPAQDAGYFATILVKE